MSSARHKLDRQNLPTTEELESWLLKCAGSMYPLNEKEILSQNHSSLT